MVDAMLARAEADAIDWVIRQRDPGFDDWDGFTLWLEQSPDHAAAYDRMALMDSDLEALPVPVPVADAPAPAPDHAPQDVANDDPVVHQHRFNRRAWLGGAMAAALVGVIGISMFNGDITRIETQAGEQRNINLADGSRIEINGSSIVEIDKQRPRYARIERGEAMFHVVHREGDPFTVDTPTAKLVDMGTAFNVIQRGDGLNVAVSEGIVLYNPARDKLRLDAGRALSVKGAGKPLVSDVDVAGVGGWRSGQLFYSGAALADVAADLSRTTGLKVEVAPAVAAKPFHGALLVGNNKAQAVNDLAALAGIRAERSGDGWTLTQ